MKETWHSRSRSDCEIAAKPTGVTFAGTRRFFRPVTPRETAAFGFGINPRAMRPTFPSRSSMSHLTARRVNALQRMSSSVPADAQRAGPGQRTRSSEVDAVIRIVDSSLLAPAAAHSLRLPTLCSAAAVS
jgi:hypothetical protein